MMDRGRKERVRLAVEQLVTAGVIRGDWQLLGQRPGLRWLLTLRQPEQGGGWWSSERALTTSEAEALVNGALTGYALGFGAGQADATAEPEPAGASRRYLPAAGEGEEPGDRLLTALLEEAASRLGPLREWRVTLDGEGEAVEAKCWGRLGFLWLRAEPASEGAVDVTALEERRV